VDLSPENMYCIMHLHERGEKSARWLTEQQRKRILVLIRPVILI